MNQEVTRPTLANLEAEQALLGAILVNNESFAIGCGGLEPEHFSEPLHARIFEAVATLIRAGKLASPLTLKTHFGSDATMKEIGGPAYLARLAASATTIINTPEYARTIRDLWLRRKVIEIAETSIVEAGELPIDLSGADFTVDFAMKLSALAMEGGDHKTRFSLREALSGAIDNTAGAYQNWGQRPDAIPTGLKALDEILGGFVKGTLVFIGGRPSMGKSSIALTLAYLAAKAGRPADFFTLEMSANDLAQRAAAIEHRVPYERVARGKITEKEFERVVEGARVMMNLPLTFIERGKITLAALSAEIAKSKMRRPDLVLVIVDQLNKIKAGPSFKGPRYEEVTAITGELQSMAKQHGVCLVILQQLARDIDKRENKRPQLADLRDSASIEQDADVIIFLYREEYYLARAEPKPNTTEHMEWQDAMDKCNGHMDLIVAKHKMGRVGAVKVKNDMPINLITDIEVDQTMEMPF